MRKRRGCRGDCTLGQNGALMADGWSCGAAEWAPVVKQRYTAWVSGPPAVVCWESGACVSGLCEWPPYQVWPPYGSGRNVSRPGHAGQLACYCGKCRERVATLGPSQAVITPRWNMMAALLMADPGVFHPDVPGKSHPFYGCYLSLIPKDNFPILLSANVIRHKSGRN